MILYEQQPPDWVRFLTCSMLRNLGAELHTMTYQGESHGVQFWWARTPVSLHHGDRITGFDTPFGLAIEAIDRAV